MANVEHLVIDMTAAEVSSFTSDKDRQGFTLPRYCQFKFKGRTKGSDL